MKMEIILITNRIKEIVNTLINPLLLAETETSVSLLLLLSNVVAKSLILL